MENANEILFRSSGFGHLMTEPKEKSDSQKYSEALILVEEYKKEYSDILNKSTKTALNKHQQILKLNTLILELEKTKDNWQPSETCRKQLIRVYAASKGRYESLSNKYLSKGNECENTSITLLSTVLKKFYRKNKERKNNEFITGEWDLDDSIEGKINETLDIKSSWSYITFLEAEEKELNSIYEWQGQCYMWLTGALKHTVCYCLVNGTYKYLNDQIRSLQWKHGVLDGDVTQDEKYIEAVKQLERNHVFEIDSFMKELKENGIDYTFRNDVWYDSEKDLYTWEFDIPKKERVHFHTIERDEEKIKQIEKRSIQCREWLNKKYFNKN